MTTTMKSFDTKVSPGDRRYLVIGATGLLGRHVVRELAGRQWPVRAMRQWDAPEEGLDFPEVDIVVGDIFDPNSLAQAVAGVNAVIYCAAPKPGPERRDILRKSVEAVRRVLAACREYDVEQMVLTSSASTIGRGAPGTRLNENHFYLPGSSDDPFTEAKYAVELECYRYVADGFWVVMLNPSLLVGPGVDLTAYARLDVDDAQPLNVIDVREAARIHAEALSKGRSGARYLLGGENTTAEQLFDGWPRRGRNDERPREAYLVESGQWLDCSLAREELGLRISTDGR